MLNVKVTEKDFETTLGPDATKQLRAAPVVQTLGPGQADAVLDALPKVISDRFKKMMPSDYEIREIALTVSLSGAPFGVGVSGEAVLTFGPKTAR